MSIENIPLFYASHGLAQVDSFSSERDATFFSDIDQVVVDVAERRPVSRLLYARRMRSKNRRVDWALRAGGGRKTIQTTTAKIENSALESCSLSVNRRFEVDGTKRAPTIRQVMLTKSSDSENSQQCVVSCIDKTEFKSLIMSGGAKVSEGGMSLFRWLLGFETLHGRANIIKLVSSVIRMACSSGALSPETVSIANSSVNPTLEKNYEEISRIRKETDVPVELTRDNSAILSSHFLGFARQTFSEAFCRAGLVLARQEPAMKLLLASVATSSLDPNLDFRFTSPPIVSQGSSLALHDAQFIYRESFTKNAASIHVMGCLRLEIQADTLPRIGWQMSREQKNSDSESKQASAASSPPTVSVSHGPELVIGLIGPIGVDLKLVREYLQSCLEDVGYSSTVIHLMDRLSHSKLAETLHIQSNSPETRYDSRMKAGDTFRKSIGRSDALGLFAMSQIRAARAKISNNLDQPVNKHAYIIHSLKTSEEVRTLRAIYGDNFIAMAVHVPRTARINKLALDIASYHAGNPSMHTGLAHDLVSRDESDVSDKFGQDMRGTFHKADVFIDALSRNSTLDSIKRFVEMLFNHPLRTPRKVEFGMFAAYGVSLRSSHSDRQIGASITDDDGEVVAMGTNEIAKPNGGLQWPEDSGAGLDVRDINLPHDSNKQTIQTILQDIVLRLRQRKLLIAADGESFDALLKRVKSALDPLDTELLANDVSEPIRAAAMDKALIFNIIEFVRTVHAEMAALMFAARRGISVKGCTMYTTTFPCHECARHIVASGIKSVVYLDPYPKSRTEQLYDDSIGVDGRGGIGVVPFSPFVGVSPTRYVNYFTLPKRKNKDDGTWFNWDANRKTQTPRLATAASTYLHREQEHIAIFKNALHGKNIFSEAGLSHVE